MAESKRRLAAIMSADVVGYSILMADDEEATVATLKEYRLAIGRLIDRLERELQESGEREVTSDHIGRRALEELSAIDVLAAVRFASVFLDFSSPGDYEAFFSELSAGGHGSEETLGDRTVRSLGAGR